ncbi:udp-sugar pyrophospharylase-like [Nannochloropsis oceanica]
MGKRKNKSKRGSGGGNANKPEGAGAADTASAARKESVDADEHVDMSVSNSGTSRTSGDASTTTARPAGLESNWAILSTAEQALAELLLKAGQAHLFDGWDTAGTNDAEKHAFFAQVQRLHDTYPDGLAAYVDRAKALLAESATGVNSLDGWTPAVPEGAILEPGSAKYCEWETAGKDELKATGFVLVAGGLGERLGFSGIKVALPTEITTKTTYMEFYCKYLLAVGAKNGGKIPPLAIMVSDDTHDRTLALLESNDYFGYPKEALTLMKQEKVAALADNDARIARAANAEGRGDGRYGIDCKPHGHGDVHSLLHRTGVAKRWKVEGLKWVVFFQDTNALAFLSLAAALGVSQKLGLEVNSIAIPRVPKQAIGAITRLTHTTEKETKIMIVNVEYNQLDPLLRASGSPEGDVADPSTGYSPYPGNINQLIFALSPYVATLNKTHGVMGEFVNPKYADAARSVFKKPTRLECMMQDYPKMLPLEAKVGFTSLPAWFSFSPVKNNAPDAAKAAQAGTPPGSASTGEADQYYAVAEQLRLLGCKVGKAPEATYTGIPVSLGPRVVIDPSVALNFSEMKKVFPSPDRVTIGGEATLVLQGPGEVEVQSLELEGALVLSVGKGTTVIVKDMVVKNKGHVVVPISGKDEPDEVLLMRGYRLEKQDELRVQAPANAGRMVLAREGNLVPEAESLPVKIAAVSAIPTKPVNPQAAHVTAPAPTPATDVELEDKAVSGNCLARAFDCFKKKPARA